MVKTIVKDIFFLNQKSEPATIADKQVGVDLLDTLNAHEKKCVGMAANMIGVKKTKPYETEECCLSLIGVRKTTRYEEITVEYEDMNFKKQKGTYLGFVAQIIQNEIDHCNGIVI